MRAGTDGGTMLTVRDWFILVIIALGLRGAVTFWFLRSMPLVSDAASYSQMATALVRSFPGDAAYFWPPGLPYVLAVFYALLGDSLTVARLVTLALGVATVILTTLLAQKILLHRGAVQLCSWIAAVYPPAVLMASQTNSNDLASVCLLLFVSLLLLSMERESLGLSAAAGLSAGFLCLTRPSAVSTLVLLPIAFLLYRRRLDSPNRTNWIAELTRLAVILLCSIACILPVAWHNASKGAGWTIATNNERNLFLGNNPYTHHYKTSHLAQRPLKELPAETQTYLRDFYSRRDRRSAMFHAALRFMIGNPWITVVRSFNRAKAFWGFDYIMSRLIARYFDVPFLWSIPLLILEAGGFFVISLLVITSLVCFPDGARAATAGVVWFLVIAYQLPYVVSFSAGVYHFAVMGLLFPFAGAGAHSLLKHGSLPHSRGRRTLFAIAVGFFVLIQMEYAYYLLEFA